MNSSIDCVVIFLWLTSSGLGSTVFRDAVYTSHEVYIDPKQVEWFEKTIKECPADEGWRVFVFTHAPPMGSGLRVLQENHVVNGCCWLNHSSKNTAQFIKIVRENPCIKVPIITHNLTPQLFTMPI